MNKYKATYNDGSVKTVYATNESEAWRKAENENFGQIVVGVEFQG